MAFATPSLWLMFISFQVPVPLGSATDLGTDGARATLSRCLRVTFSPSQRSASSEICIPMADAPWIASTLKR